MCSAIGEGCTIYHSDYTMDCEGLSKIKKVLTLEQRILVLKKIDSGRSVKEVATEFGCSITQISGIKRKRDSLVKQWEDGGRADQKFMKKRKTIYEDLNVAVWEWFCQVRAKNIPISGKLIQVSFDFVSRSL